MLFKTLFFILFIPFYIFAGAGYNLPWGKDADLLKVEDPALHPLPRKDILSKAAEKIILFHQNIISPVDGPRSNFRPTSARYMLLAIRRYGFFKGYMMGCNRLLRENSDDWVYRTIVIDGVTYKWDPTFKIALPNTAPLITHEKGYELR